MLDQYTKTIHNMSIYSEFNVEHNGAGFVSIRIMILEIETYKSEKLLISGKFELWPHITGSKFDLGSKNVRPLAITHRVQSGGLFR